MFIRHWNLKINILHILKALIVQIRVGPTASGMLVFDIHAYYGQHDLR